MSDRVRSNSIIDFINTIDHPDCIRLSKIKELYDGSILVHVFNELIRVLKIKNIFIEKSDKEYLNYSAIYDGLILILRNMNKLDNIYKIENRVKIF